jgi:2-aminoadipate transaminase
MGSDFADRMGSVHKSFIREILKVTQDPSIISFGGGLPNPSSFPILEISEAAEKVLRASGEDALQYSTTEGYLPLREIIAERYARRGLKVSPHNILITSGSQQGIDLTGKVFINKSDPVLVERPTYLATLQAYGLYEPEFRSITLQEDGPGLAALERELARGVKLFYAVPNFQNPTGITYSLEKRRAAARLLEEHDTVFVEDDPYGEIRFMGEDLSPVKSFVERSVLLGSFSKIVSPGMRLGWLVAPDDIMDKVIVAKQATDLHTNYFIQRVVHRYMADNDVDAHIGKIKALYRKQRDHMVAAIKAHFPDGVQCTKPEGGMFLWVTLPEGVSSVELFDLAIKEKVAFVPGKAFFADGSGDNTLRLNYTNSSVEAIDVGIERLGDAIRQLMAEKAYVCK